MKNILSMAASLALAATNTASAVTIVDNFNSGVGGTTVVILDNVGGGSNAFSWDTSDGTARFVTTSVHSTSVEQTATTYAGFSLAIGEELQVDVGSTPGGSQDIGLYVGGVVPTVGVRSTYVNIYVRNNGEVYSRGFDGTTELGLVGGATVTLDKLFIARTDTNDYELGYYDGGTRNIVSIRTGLTNNDADSIGLYTDVRATGTLRAVDNLVIVPEPSLALLGGLGVLGLLRRRR